MATNGAFPPPPPGYSADQIVPQGGAGASSSSPPPPPPGYSADQIVPVSSQPTSTAPAAPAASQTDSKPGLLDRMYETSGAKGLVDLAVGTVNRPIDLYHQAVDAAKKGDWKTASEQASKLLNMPVTGGLTDKGSPLYKAAEALIMQPVNEVQASYNEKRKAGQSKTGAAISTAGQMLSHTPDPHELANTVNRVKGDWAKRDYSAIMGDIIGGQTENHASAAVPVMGAAMKQVGGDLDQDLHDHNYSAAAGDVLGPLATLGIGKLVGALGIAGGAAEGAGTAGEAAEGAGATSEGAGATAEGAEAGSAAPPPKPTSPPPVPTTPTTAPTEGIAKAIKPGEETIAGQRVPVAADTPQSRALSTFASKNAAKTFIKDQVQPAAVKATQANFAKSALEATDELRSIRGEPLTSDAPPPPNVGTVDQLAKFLQDEAKGTYSKLDEAAKPALEEWEQKYGGQEEGSTTSQPSKLLDQYGNPISSGEGEAVPPKPKLFTELQDQIKDAQRVIDSQFSSQADKAAAIEDLPKFRKEMTDFLDTHAGVVDQGELAAANKVWGKSMRYQWLADKMRGATKGVGAQSGELTQTPRLNLSTMESMPNTFDTRFGEGAFKELLGPEGVKNYDRVLNVLKEPKAGGALMQWLSDVPLNLGKLAKTPVNYVVDNLLFNPEFGQKTLKLWDASAKGAKFAKAASQAVVKPAVKAAPAGVAATNTSGDSTKRSVYSGLSSSLGDR